jgi:23S rRNA (uracil1939-C5)-methyltransferase
MQVKIDKLVNKGDGLARIEDGKVIFIPYSIPGEIVKIGEIHDNKGVFSAAAEEIETASPHRIQPECPYFGECGGCQYQHIHYARQLEIKREILIEQLERIGGFTGVQVNNSVASARQFAYRNHVQFHLDPNGKPGFQRTLSHDVVAVEKCLIAEDTVNALLKTLNFDPESGIERVAIRDDGQGIPLVFLTGSTNNPPEFEVDFPLNVVFRSPAGDIPLSGETFNQFTIWGKEFQVSAGSFFQTNVDVAEKMAQIVCELAGTAKRSTIVDCYCGVGFFSRFLMERAGRLVGIESSEDACNDFAVNLDEFDNVELYQGNVEAVLPELDILLDLVVVDPPRAGIAPAGLKALLKSKPDQIIYVSCDPSTLARDLKSIVGAGYSIESITPIDMFPQTYHIESITNLRRK